MSDNHNAPSAQLPAKRFGTFLGVYTPSVLTILGVMMYLRFGWLLAHLLNLNFEWRQARVTVRTVVEDETARLEMDIKLATMIRDARIDADYDVSLRPRDRTVFELMHEASDQADVVFVGLPIPASGEELEAAQRLRTMVDGFSTTALVNSAGPFAGQLI